MAADAPPPLSRRERFWIGFLGLLGGFAFLAGPKLLSWWLVWVGAQLAAIEALLGLH